MALAPPHVEQIIVSRTGPGAAPSSGFGGGQGFFGIGAGPGAGKSAGVTVFREQYLSADQYVANRYIHECTAVARLCAAKMKEQATLEEPEMWVGGKRVNMTPYMRKLFRDEWIPFAHAWMDEWWTRGIVPIALRASRDKQDTVPVVVNDVQIYAPTVYYDLVENSKGYRVWRRFDKRTGRSLDHPVVDATVMVMSGYDADPNADGSLNTVLSSLQREEAFQQLITVCAARAEPRRCEPFMFGEITDKGAGASKDADTLVSYFSNHDTQELRKENAFLRTAAEMQAVMQSKAVFQTYWKDVIAADQAFGETGLTPAQQQERLARQQGTVREAADMVVRVLPVGQHAVPAPVPQPRNDYVAITESHQELVCAVYRVPRRILLGEMNATATGARVSSATFDEAVRGWRIRLSRVFTELYRCIYTESDCSMLLQKGLLRPHTDLRDVEIRFPDVVTADMPTIMQLYATQMLPWANARTSALRLNHMYVPGMVDADEEDPWASEVKSTMLSAQAGEMGLTGAGAASEVVFGIGRPEGPNASDKREQKRQKEHDAAMREKEGSAKKKQKSSKS